MVKINNLYKISSYFCFFVVIINNIIYIEFMVKIYQDKKICQNIKLKKNSKLIMYCSFYPLEVKNNS